MNTFVVYVVITLALAHGLDGIYVRLDDKTELYDADGITSTKRRENQICKPWSMQRMYCNNCFCFARGFGWVCGTKNCTQTPDGHLKLDANISEAREEADQLSRYRLEISEDFDHKVELYKDRNSYTRVRRSARKNRICAPGSTKMMACNRCVCLENGFSWFCSMRGCLPTTNSDVVQIRH